MNMFNKVQIRPPKRAKFDLTHSVKGSIRMGYLYPVFVSETLPTDSFSQSAEILAKFAPMLAPVMDQIQCKIDYFWCPMRLLYEGFEDFRTKGRLGTSNEVAPYIEMDEDMKSYTAKGSLLDWFGFPDMSTQAFGANKVNISALPLRAYLLVWNEYYRNQNVTAPIDMPLTGGPIPSSAGDEFTDLLTLRKTCWEKDYFTSALPFTQRGSEVLIPFEADVTYKVPAVASRSWPPLPPGPVAGDVKLDASGNLQDSASNPITLDNIESIENGTITINDLRRAERLQEWLEKNAVAGGRYKEFIMAHFAGFTSDGRLQRPEYLGGGRTNVVISETLSTATNEDDAGVPPQGNMAGNGVAYGRTNKFRRKFEEDGIVLGLLRVLPRTSYMQGIPKWLQRFDTFDYASPEFAQIGEQPIMKRELFAKIDDVPATYDEVFGYQSRYAEYKYIPSRVHGDMKDNLDYWTMGRIFEDVPALNQNFVEADPTNRIFSVINQDVDNIYVHIRNRTHAVRPLPYFGTPTL